MVVPPRGDSACPRSAAQTPANRLLPRRLYCRWSISQRRLGHGGLLGGITPIRRGGPFRSWRERDRRTYHFPAIRTSHRLSIPVQQKLTSTHSLSVPQCLSLPQRGPPPHIPALGGTSRPPMPLPSCAVPRKRRAFIHIAAPPRKARPTHRPLGCLQVPAHLPQSLRARVTRVPPA